MISRNRVTNHIEDQVWLQTCKQVYDQTVRGQVMHRLVRLLVGKQINNNNPVGNQVRDQIADDFQ
jgi:hypothetical protein